MLRQNEWHLKHMPVLTYVDHFDFMTPITLEECSQRLAKAVQEIPQRMKLNVYEVLAQPNADVVFGAKYAMNQSAWYMAGEIKPTGQQNRVRCYTGLPIATLTLPFLILVMVLVVVGITNHLSAIAVIGLFVAVLIITGLVGIRYVRTFRQTLERDIRKLLT